MTSPRYEPRTALGRAVNAIEETAIAVLIGLMTIITFINVPVRYLFDGVPLAAPFDFIVLPKLEFLWAVEMTGFLFAWLVLIGISHLVKLSANLGIDVAINLLSPAGRRALGLASAAVCVAYALLLLKAAWDFWAPFANLPPTTGRWFPTGLDFGALGQGWYEVNDTPMPSWLRFLEDVFNEGEEYEKLPRVLPYAVLPLGALLLLVRFVQATLRIWRGTQDRLIAGHEAEDLVDERAAGAGRGGA
ncbi:MAG: TRAP transporter small permease subunit [Alphaproteobacteria bacterium]|nr:MAG: TRAP transporter small permease subunit [Alphaproteobacteria bacterium]